MNDYQIFSDDTPVIIRDVRLLNGYDYEWLVWDGEYLSNNGIQFMPKDLMHFTLNGTTYHRCIDGNLRPEDETT